MNNTQDENDDWKEKFMRNYQDMINNNRAQKEETLEKLYKLLNTDNNKDDNSLFFGEDGFTIY